MTTSNTKNSTKLIKSLKRLPQQLEQANAFFLQFQHYNGSQPLISYFCGVYTVQLILEVVLDSAAKSNKGNRALTEHLMNVLEQRRGQLEKDPQQGAILHSTRNSREYIISYTEELYDQCVMELETDTQGDNDHNQDKRRVLVDRLLKSAVLFEAAKGLFPYSDTYHSDSYGKEDDKEDDKEEEKEEDKERETLLNDGSEDLVESMKQLTSDTLKDTQLDDHITLGFKNIANVDDKLHETTIEDKEDMIINKLITQQLSAITDEDLDQRITYCRDNAKKLMLNGDKDDNNLETTIISEEEINKTIKDALQDDDYNEENDAELSVEFPVIPGHIQSEEEEEHEHEDGNEHEHEHDQIKPRKSIEITHKQLTKEDVSDYLQDEQLLQSAQKYAKYAISAMNYEDVDTAVEELNKAVELLKKHSKSS